MPAKGGHFTAGAREKWPLLPSNLAGQIRVRILVKLGAPHCVLIGHLTAFPPESLGYFLYAYFGRILITIAGSATFIRW